MLTKLHLTQNNNIICAGDFNLLFNIKLESYGGNPVFKKRSVRKIFELKETYNLTDIWRIRNPKAKQYTNIIPAISSDHSPILFSFSKDKLNKSNQSSGF